MERDSLKLNTYKISGDNSLLDELNHITPEVRRILEEIHPEILKGSKDLIKKLDKLCLKYPRVPVFKNMLSSVYQQNDNTKQAYAVNRWLVKEHPDYLFGKLNLAAEFLLNYEPEKIPEILGEMMEISELYPNRKEFHVEEVIGFNHISIQYFLALDNIEQAQVRLKIMEDLDEDHPKTQYAREYLQEWYFYKASERLEDEDLLKKSVLVKSNRSQLQTTRMPEFHFPKEMGWLYQNDLNVDHEIIEEILKLNSSRLREDLEKMLEDSIARFDHFSEKLEKEGYNSEEFSFPMHALLLLSELKSEQSLPLILQVLQQDREFNELWFGEFINEVMENALYHCGTNQTQLLFDFLRLPNVYNMNKACVGEALVKIIEGSSEKREVFVEQYRRILNVYIENAADENYADTDAIGFIISDITDLAYKELLPEIKQLFDLDLVGFWICGIYEEIKTEIQGEPYNQNIEFINQDIFEKYYELSQFEDEEFSDLDDEFSDLDLNQDEINKLYYEEILNRTPLNNSLNEPIEKSKKIGRNDPCPCGSDKKYKKCCMDN